MNSLYNFIFDNFFFLLKIHIFFINDLKNIEIIDIYEFIFGQVLVV